MIEEYAVVTSCVNSRATLEIERRTVCSLCGQKRGCGNATWGKLLGHKSHAFEAENPIHANVGDNVVVGVDEHTMLNSVFLLYIVPLLAMLIGAVLADNILKNEFLVILSAALGLVLSFLWVKRHLMHKKGQHLNTQCYAVILRHADETISDENNVEMTKAITLDASVKNFQIKRGQ